MTMTAVDSTILLDVLADDPEHGDASQKLLEREIRRGNLIISDVVYAEIAVLFGDQELLNQTLSRMNIEVVHSGSTVAFLASQKWQEHQQRMGKNTRLLNDFLIGAHAQVYTGRLLARDRGFYGAYFPDLNVVES